MGLTFAEKALARAAGLETAVAGQIVDARPDVALSHDNTAAIARIFRDLRVDRVCDPDQLAVVLDHAVPAPNTQHAANHAEIRRFVAQQGIEHFFDAGRGICHQVVAEEALVLPGQLILGADSHTTHAGWMGAFGAGVGRTEMAAIWATGALWLRVPESVRVDLTGVLPAGVTGKDLALWVLYDLRSHDTTYRSVEFGGPGVASLMVDDRMVVANTMAEAGVKNAYITPDEVVFDWLADRVAARTTRQAEACRADIVSAALYPDPDAAYAARYTLDLGLVELAVSCPHAPAVVRSLSDVAGVRVDQAFIGTCTNGRLSDLAEAAAVLRGPTGEIRRVATGTRMVVIPASAQVLREAIAAGYIDTFIAAGAMIGTPGCGPCMGNHMGVPAPGEVTISTANRNFRGRMGTRDSQVYLASPAVVAASAVLGVIADPEEVVGRRWQVAGHGSRGSATRGRYPRGRAGLVPVASLVNGPVSGDGDGKTSTGPSTPKSSAISLTGRAWRYGDDVNTDLIFPGKYTYTVTDPSEMARHALEDLDPGFSEAVQAGDVIVAGRNWGCGSSREQAVTCLAAAGVRVIIAESFARIFFRNAINNGVLPVICPEAVAVIQPGERVTVDLGRSVVCCRGGEFPFAPLSRSLAEIFDAGGLVPMLRRRQFATA